MLNCLGICNREGIRLAGAPVTTIKDKPGSVYEIGGAYCRTCERRILLVSLKKGKCPCCKGKVRLKNRNNNRKYEEKFD